MAKIEPIRLGFDVVVTPRREASPQRIAGGVFHRCPREGEHLTPCCGKVPTELVGDRLTTRQAEVTCRVDLCRQLRSRAYDFDVRGAVDVIVRDNGTVTVLGLGGSMRSVVDATYVECAATTPNEIILAIARMAEGELPAEQVAERLVIDNGDGTFSVRCECGVPCPAWHAPREAAVEVAMAHLYECELEKPPVAPKPESLPEGVEKFECRRCDGKGAVRFDRNGCADCNGTGWELRRASSAEPPKPESTLVKAGDVCPEVHAPASGGAWVQHWNEDGTLYLLEVDDPQHAYEPETDVEVIYREGKS